jgi:hypothetical protein
LLQFENFHELLNFAEVPPTSSEYFVVAPNEVAPVFGTKLKQFIEVNKLNDFKEFNNQFIKIREDIQACRSQMIKELKFLQRTTEF